MKYNKASAHDSLKLQVWNTNFLSIVIPMVFVSIYTKSNVAFIIAYYANILKQFWLSSWLRLPSPFQQTSALNEKQSIRIQTLFWRTQYWPKSNQSMEKLERHYNCMCGWLVYHLHFEHAQPKAWVGLTPI